MGVGEATDSAVFRGKLSFLTVRIAARRPTVHSMTPFFSTTSGHVACQEHVLEAWNLDVHLLQIHVHSGRFHIHVHTDRWSGSRLIGQS